MVRPRKLKKVHFEPDVTYFKPQGVPLNELEDVIISIDELETLRLSNLENLSQSEAAKKMEIHQSTFQRTLTRARKKITDALVNGKTIIIHGGEFKMPNGDGTGPQSGAGRGQGFGAQNGQGRGLGRGPGAGPTGTCVCPKCGYEEPHTRGNPCFKRTCPKCGATMTRKE